MLKKELYFAWKKKILPEYLSLQRVQPGKLDNLIGVNYITKNSYRNLYVFPYIPIFIIRLITNTNSIILIFF